MIIKYPDGELWLRAFYRKYGDEALVQYLPKNETRENWTRSIFVHSYNESAYPVNVFIANNLAFSLISIIYYSNIYNKLQPLIF